MSNHTVKLVTFQNPEGHVCLGINLKDAQIPLAPALRSGWHVEPLKGGRFIDIQHAIRWYAAAGDAAAVEGLISAAQRGRALLTQGS